MNKVILIGRFTKDPETRTAGETFIATGDIAVNRYSQNGEKKADFISIVAFGNIAKFINKFFMQGSKIAIEGRLQTGSYTDKEGIRRKSTDVIVERAEFADGYKGEKDVTESDAPNNGEWVNVPKDIENDLPFK